MNEKLKTFLAALAGGVIAIALTHTVIALADGNPTTDQVPKLIPYQGTLEKDGAGVTGQVQMTFTLYDGPSATTPAWTEQQTVSVYAGRFLAMLGSASATSASSLALVLTNADDLYLAVTLNTASGDVALANRQRFLPVPYSMWTTAATSFKVSTLDAPSGTAMCVNCVARTAVQVGGTLNLRAWDLAFTPWDTAARGDGGRALSLTASDTLTVNFAGDFAGGVRIEGAVAMPGSVTVGTTLSVGVSPKECSGGAWDCVCPTGRYAISGGYMCPSGSTGVMSYPTPDPQSGSSAWTGWHATCQNTSGTEVKPSSVWVICSKIN